MSRVVGAIGLRRYVVPDIPRGGMDGGGEYLERGEVGLRKAD